MPSIAATGPGVDESRLKVLKGAYSYASISDKISDIVLTRPTHWGFHAVFALCTVLTILFVIAIIYLFYEGVGIWGIDIPIAWAFAITNFVWWVGIGHAGTFISAFLLLLRQKWRTSVNRFAEAMTIFAVAMAGVMPILHLGRPWFFYWLVPYPDIMNVWPQWRSPLVWDIFAISTYLLVSLLFWYMGLIPDLATLRDRATSRVKQVVYALFALGWRGEARHWKRFEVAYLLVAGLAAPLFSGFAMVLVLAIPMRKFFGLEAFITMRHLDNAAKLMLATELVLAYGYLAEIFTGFYSGDKYEIAITVNRFVGPYAPVYWALFALNIFMPQLLWFRRIRRSTFALFVIGILVNVGMWMERFMIVVSSLNRDFLPSSWGLFIPTWVDWSMLAGSI